MTKGRRFTLWGFDGDLEGEEARLQGRLPFFRASSDPRIFAARHANWTFDPQDKLTVLASEPEAEQAGTKLQLDRARTILPGELVVIYGPDFVRDLGATSPNVKRNLSRLRSTPSGFRVTAMPVETYEQLARSLSDQAKVVFDQEILEADGAEVSSKAEAALNVFRNTGSAPVRDEMIRTLLAKRIKVDHDGYRRSLKLGALRLGVSTDELETDVSRHLRLLLESETLTDPVEGLGDSHLPDLDDSFEALFTRYYRPLSNFFFRKGFSPEECQDLIQETFLRVFRSMDTFRDKAPLKAWLFRIATNIYRNTLRERGTSKRDAQEVAPDEATDQSVATWVNEDQPLQSTLNGEQQQKLLKAMEQLPPGMRRCVQLRIDYDLRYREIAVILGISIDTVKSLLYQARLALGDALSAEENLIDNQPQQRSIGKAEATLDKTIGEMHTASNSLSPAALLAEANRLHDLENAAKALRKEFLRRAATGSQG